VVELGFSINASVKHKRLLRKYTFIFKSLTIINVARRVFTSAPRALLTEYFNVILFFNFGTLSVKVNKGRLLGWLSLFDVKAEGPRIIYKDVKLIKAFIT
jgi:hypothetical protein